MKNAGQEERLYYVKWKDAKGVVRYGTVDYGAKEAKQAAGKGMLIVADAITPERFMLPRKALTPLKVGFDDNEYDDFVEAELKKALKASKGLKEFGPGALFGIGVADGTAWYVVTAMGGGKCRVEWRGFCLDRWADHHFGYGGTFKASDVKRYWSRD